MARMLILRSAGIGDVAMLVHAVRALRQTYPDLEIVIATKPRMPAFFTGIEGLQFIEIKGFRQLLKDIRAAQPDCVADLRNEFRGKLVRLIMGLRGVPCAKYRQRYAQRRPLLRPHNKQLVWLENNVLRFCDVFAELSYPVEPPALARWQAPLPPVFGEKTGRWAGYAPFAASELKIYPEPQRTELVKALAARFDKVFLFSGGGEELAFCQRMASACPNVVPVFKKTDLAGEVSLMSRLDVIITMDSSAMHMASLAGAPLLAIWGSTHPAVGYSAWGADPSRNYLQLDLPCRPCSVYGEGKCRLGGCPCLKDISVESILAKAESLIADAGNGPESGQ